MPWGIKELKYFFSEGILTNSGNISSKNIKEKIREIIENEDKTKPYGDNELTELLQKKGLNIARRTVSKYREDLNYNTARLRKELN